jgi:hypothetical protein
MGTGWQHLLRIECRRADGHLARSHRNALITDPLDAEYTGRSNRSTNIKSEMQMNGSKVVSLPNVRRFMLVAIATVSLSSSAFAQQGAGAPYGAGYKDPGTATLFSVLLTGGGHFYSGETRKGATLLGVGLGSFIAGAAMSGGVSCSDYSCSNNTTPLVVGSLVYLGTWIYGIVDSGNAARRQNAIHGFNTVGLSPTVKPLNNGRSGIGLEVAIGR